MLGQVWRADDTHAVVRSPADLGARWPSKTAPGSFALQVLPEELAALAVRLDLPPTAVADALADPDGLPQRTRYARHDRWAFLFLYAVVPTAPSATTDADRPPLTLVAVPVFASRAGLVVVDHGWLGGLGEATPLLARHALAARATDARAHRTAGLLHLLLDAVVDTHLAAADLLAAEIEGYEDAMFDERSDADPRELQRRSVGTRKALARLRRVATPVREVVAAAMRSEEDDPIPVGPSLLPLYQDVYDHSVHATENLEGLRDLLATLYEARIAIADHVMNTVMKRLAAWAAIVAVPTAVTGFYGQNVPYPGFGTWAGFVVSTVVWVGLSLTLYLAFRVRRWL